MLDIKAISAILAGVVVVGGVGTYVFLENSSREDQPMQVSSNPAISATEASKDEMLAQSSEGTDKDLKSSKDAEVKDGGVGEKADRAKKDTAIISSDEPTTNWTMPAFDVLRVEPDGSTVIAGQGQPNTTLKVMNGEEVLNEVEIGSTGDFVVIFDQPLASGDYQLTLKVEDENGDALLSDETAIVSVPEDANGQLLAMVTKPGQASRILAQPEVLVLAADSSDVSVDERVEVAANTAITENGVETEKKIPAASANKQESDDGTAPKLAKTDDADVTMKNSDNGNASIAADKVASAKQIVTEVAKPTEKLVFENDKEINASNDTSTMAKNTAAKEVEIVKKEAVQNVKDTATKIIETAKVYTNVEGMEKTLEASSQESMEKAAEKIVTEVQPKDDSIVRIEAVEVEGNRLFVAGVASKGNTVRILVDGNEVGAVDVNGEGRFLIETRQELSVGPHMITAALEDKPTKKIVLRAVVPFNRPEAESAAAIAAIDTKSEKTENAVVSKKDSLVNIKDDTMVKTEVASNDAEGQKSENANKQELAAVNSSDNSTTPKQSDAAKIVKDGSETMDNMEAKPETIMAKSDGEASKTKDEPQTIIQDTLTPATSQSVIIRKGDTLWQIARRTYGAGVRYTTIYLANQEQIQNPDRIAPGQIFMVPAEALENAEELHQKRLQGN